MRHAFPAALILALATSGAQAAAFQVETRAFHSNLRLDHKEAIHTINGRTIATQGGGESFQNTAGGAVSFVAQLDDDLSLGVGYEHARYFPDPDMTLDQQTLSFFTRWTLYQGSLNQLHLLAGLSQHTLTGEGEPLTGAEVEVKYTPVMNYDLGVGHTWTFGLWNVGLAYKYSDSFGRGNSRTVMRSRVYNEFLLVDTEVKTKMKNFNIEQQTVSLSFGVNL